jgi:hypothetical protein
MSARLVLGLAVVAVTGLVGLAVWQEIDSLAEQTDLSIAREYWDDRRVEIEIAADKFDLARTALTGKARISVRPNSQAAIEQIAAVIGIFLDFNHFIRPADGEAYYLEQGGSEELIALKAGLHGSVSGAGDFAWAAEEVRSAFYYPFDEYRLHVNPSVRIQDPQEVGRAYTPAVDRFELFFRVPNLTMSVTRLAAPEPEDWHVIVLERPLTNRILAVTIIGLGLIWLVYLAEFAKPETHVAQLVAFFVGIWGLRSAYGGDDDIYPTLADFLVILLSLLAIVIVLARWFQASLADQTRKCPYCRQAIAHDATRCPYCTQQVPVAYRETADRIEQT